MHKKVKSIVEVARSLLPMTVKCVEVKEMIDQRIRDN
jgi:hypothetical protein